MSERINIRLVAEQPLAMDLSAVEAMLAVDNAILERLDRVRAATPEPSGGGVIAILPVYGAIAQRPDIFMAMFGGVSVVGLTARFRAAMADPAVRAIILDFSSPGGTVYGLPDLAKEIRAARGQKPVVAMVNSKACSGAYWIAAQADTIVAAPLSEVGSIGVYMIHLDRSEEAAKVGVKPTIISAGDLKGDATGLAPLSEEGQAAMQSMVDASYQAFINDVAKGRGVSAEVVRSSFGRGAVVTATAAKAAGMVDRVASLDEVVSTLMSPSGRKSMMRALGDDGTGAGGTGVQAEQLGDAGEAERRLLEAALTDAQ